MLFSATLVLYIPCSCIHKIGIRAANDPWVFTIITVNAPTRAFSWLKVPTSAFTFKTLLRHYAKHTLTPPMLSIHEIDL